MKINFWWQFPIQYLGGDPYFVNFFQVVDAINRMRVCNGLAVELPILRGEQEDTTDKIKISTALIPCFSLFEHNFLSMIDRKMQGEHVVVSSLVPIKKGQLIIHSRSTGIIIDDKSTRAFLLQD